MVIVGTLFLTVIFRVVVSFPSFPSSNATIIEAGPTSPLSGIPWSSPVTDETKVNQSGKPGFRIEYEVVPSCSSSASRSNE